MYMITSSPCSFPKLLNMLLVRNTLSVCLLLPPIATHERILTTIFISGITVKDPGINLCTGLSPDSRHLLRARGFPLATLRWDNVLHSVSIYFRL